MKLISSQEHFRNSLIKLTVDEVLDPEGFPLTRAIVHHAGSAVVLARDARGRILLVRQFRVPARSYLWELPAGKIDEGETALKAAKRELKEETGFGARRWTKLVSFWASPGFLGEKMNIFLAEDLVEGKATPMDDERIERRWFTVKELEADLTSGKLEDGKTMIGLYLWKLLPKRAKPITNGRP
jgi:ADP-ribose pyrophosphatase